MALLTLITGVAIVGAVAFVLLLFYQNWKHAQYFKKKGVPYIGVGMPRLFRFFTGQISMSEAEMMIYSDAKKTGNPFVGFGDFFVTPSFYVTDLDVCKNIYVKDFDHFVDRRIFSTNNKSDLLLKKMLVSLESDHWKAIRSKLSPAFTTGKIRRMFTIFDKSSHRMCDYVENVVGPNGGDFDICLAYSKYAMDVIASCAFGIDSKCYNYEPGKMSEFEEMGNRFQLKFKPTVFLKMIVMLAAPKLADALGLEAFDSEPQNYFLRVIKEVMRHRRENGERREDFLQLMMDTQDGLLKNEENSKETLEVMTGSDGAETGSDSNKHFVTSNGTSFKFDDDDIVANCVLFLIGGFDTTQSLLIFAAYAIALEQECQTKLRQEVRDAMDANKGKLTYEAVHGMSYLDNVINETLRFYPPAMRTERRCTKDYKIPGTDVVIEKGTIVGLPVAPLHHDPDHYENPEKFDPDRFLPENKNKRHLYSFAPFGHGPRNCIGMRFALTEVKMLIATLVHKFKLEPCARTEIPVKFASNSSLKPLNGMWLRFRSLKNESEE